MHYLGEEGYLRLARETMDAAERLIAGIEAIAGLHVLGRPDMSVLAIGSREHDILAAGDTLAERGWHFDRQDGPPALHLMVSPRHSLVIDEFLADLRYAVQHHAGASANVASYGDDVSAEAAGRPTP